MTSADATPALPENDRHAGVDAIVQDSGALSVEAPAIDPNPAPMIPSGLAVPTDLIGAVLHNTYRFERILGDGGMGTVYEVAHLRLRRRFAIKLLYPSVRTNAEAMERFRREALITSELGHPHIIEVVDFNYLDDGTPYLVMEMLEGEDLDNRLCRLRELGVQMPLADVASILRQATSALSAAHERGIIHRDLKPSNIFLSPRRGQGDYVKVLDFGISKVVGASTQLTCAERVMGTPSFMAPEQATGKTADVTDRTDIFSMGSILYTMLAGTTPFRGEGIPQILYRVVNEAPQDLCSIRPDLSPTIASVVSTALAKNPGDRHSSMAALWHEFSAAMPSSSSREIRATASHSSTPHDTTQEVPIYDVPPLRKTTHADETTPVALRKKPKPAFKISPQTMITIGSACIATVCLLLLALNRSNTSTPSVASLQLKQNKAVAPKSVADTATQKRAQQSEKDTSLSSTTAPTKAAETATLEEQDLEQPIVRELTVSSTPNGASVMIDGRPFGETPLRGVEVGLKEIEVAVSLSGYIDKTKTIPAGSAAENLVFKLHPKKRATVAHPPVRRAVLKVGTISGDRPLWANVYLDGRLVGQSPLVLNRVLAGTHVVSVERQGYRRTKKRVRLRPGSKTTVLIRLTEKNATRHEKAGTGLSQ